MRTRHEYHSRPNETHEQISVKSLKPLDTAATEVPHDMAHNEGPRNRITGRHETALRDESDGPKNDALRDPKNRVATTSDD